MSKIFPGNKRKTPGRKPNGRPVVQFRTRQLKFAGWVEGQKLSYPGRLMSARAPCTPVRVVSRTCRGAAPRETQRSICQVEMIYGKEI